MWCRALFLLLIASLSHPAGAFDAHVLDPDFGVQGKRTVAFDLGGERTDTLAGAFTTNDGKTMLVGQVSIASGSRVGLARLLADGSLDTSFGSGGKLVLDLCMARVSGVRFLGGQFVVFGETTECSTDGTRDVRVARLQANGSLDPSFGSGGMASFRFKPNAADSLYAIHHYQADGRLMLLGSATVQGQSIERPDGQIIASNGIDTLALLGGLVADLPESARFRSVVSAGSNVYILVARDGDTLATSGGIIRITSQLQASQPVPFAGTGTTVATCSLSLAQRPSALVQVGGYIYAVGTTQFPFLGLFYSSVSVTDLNQGRRTECFEQARMYVDGATYDTVNGPGEAYLAGTCIEPIAGGTTSAMCVARLRSTVPGDPRLALDTSFNPDGGLPVRVGFTAAAGQTPVSFGSAVLRRGAGRTQVLGTRRWNGADEDYAVAQFGTSALLRNGFE